MSRRQRLASQDTDALGRVPYGFKKRHDEAPGRVPDGLHLAESRPFAFVEVQHAGGFDGVSGTLDTKPKTFLARVAEGLHGLRLQLRTGLSVVFADDSSVRVHEMDSGRARCAHLHTSKVRL